MHWDKGHGRIEWRQLEASTALAGYLDWPGAARVCRIERRRRIRGGESAEVVHAITSLGPDRATGAYIHQESWEFGDTIRLPDPFDLEIDTTHWVTWEN